MTRIEEIRNRAELSEIVRHWQKFAAKLAKILGCFSMDEDILAEVKKLVSKVEAAEKLAQKYEAAAKLIHHGQYHGWADFDKCGEKSCQDVREALAAYRKTTGE